MRYTADEKGKCHVRGAKHVITCPKVTRPRNDLKQHVTLLVVRLAGGLEPKADFSTWFERVPILGYQKLASATSIPFPLIHTLNSYGDHPGKSLPHPSSMSPHPVSSSALLVGRRPLRPPNLCSPLLPGHHHPQSSFLLVVQRSVAPSRPGFQRTVADNTDHMNS